MKTQTVTITLLDKPYQINCTPDEREELIESARMLNLRMLDVKKTGAVIGLERIAIMAALNLAHEVVRAQQAGATTDMFEAGIGRLQDKICDAIKDLNQN